MNMLNTLSGRFLILTTVFVMLAEVLIFVPSVARFRQDYLMDRLERAQIASLALLAEDMISADLEAELLQTAEVFNVVLRRNQARQLVLSSPIAQPVHATYDLRDPGALELIKDALTCLITREDRVIRVIGEPVRQAGLLIEVTLSTEPLRAAMLDYGVRVLILSAVISVVTALLLFVAVRRILVLPIKGVVRHMQSYANAPEDARTIIKPSASVTELLEAEQALHSLQTQLTGALKQKERLAQLGSAVAKISHDLRNILTSAQLFTDRIETSQDPVVARLVPKLVNSMTRAVTLCETTLAYGRAEEPAPSLAKFELCRLIDDVAETESLAATGHDITIISTVAKGLYVNADFEQLHRVASNLVRNARQAMGFMDHPGLIEIGAENAIDYVEISIQDNGPGLPPKARDNLFTAFQGAVRKGGSGLGLAISAELIRGHGGTLTLQGSDVDGTRFLIRLPHGAAKSSG